MNGISGLLYSEMLFLFVCFIVYYPHSKLKYLFALPIGFISVAVGMKYCIHSVSLHNIDLLSYLVSIGIIGALVIQKKRNADCP